MVSKPFSHTIKQSSAHQLILQKLYKGSHRVRNSEMKTLHRNLDCPEIWMSCHTWLTQSNEPAHEIMTLFVLCKLILQTHMWSHPVGPDVWFSVRPFVYFHTSCVRTAKAQAKLRRLAWAFAGGLCDKYHNIRSWLKYSDSTSRQTEQTQIRLLLSQQSDQGLHCLPYHLKSHSSNFRIVRL